MFSCIAKCETSLEFLQSQVWIRVVLPLVVVGLAELRSSGRVVLSFGGSFHLLFYGLDGGNETTGSSGVSLLHCM